MEETTERYLRNIKCSHVPSSYKEAFNAHIAQVERSDVIVLLSGRNSPGSDRFTWFTFEGITVKISDTSKFPTDIFGGWDWHFLSLLSL